MIDGVGINQSWKRKEGKTWTNEEAKERRTPVRVKYERVLRVDGPVHTVHFGGVDGWGHDKVLHVLSCLILNDDKAKKTLLLPRWYVENKSLHLWIVDGSVMPGGGVPSGDPEEKGKEEK